MLFKRSPQFVRVAWADVWSAHTSTIHQNWLSVAVAHNTACCSHEGQKTLPEYSIRSHGQSDYTLTSLIQWEKDHIHLVCEQVCDRETPAADWLVKRLLCACYMSSGDTSPFKRSPQFVRVAWQTTQRLLTLAYVCTCFAWLQWRGYT